MFRPRGCGAQLIFKRSLTLFPLLYALRLLGHLLHLAPAGHGQGQVQREITLAADGENSMELAQHYLNHFLKTCKSLTSRYPGIRFTYWSLHSQA